MRLLACIALAACWTGDPPPPEPPRPPPPAPQHVQPHEPAPAAPTPPLDETALRTGALHLLPSYVVGPVVFLDLDQQTVTTLCGAAATKAAALWALRFMARDVQQLWCRPAGQGHFVCKAVGNGSVELDLVDADRPELVSAIAGTTAPGSGLNALLAQFKAQLANPVCP